MIDRIYKLSSMYSRLRLEPEEATSYTNKGWAYKDARDAARKYLRSCSAPTTVAVHIEDNRGHTLGEVVRPKGKKNPMKTAMYSLYARGANGEPKGWRYSARTRGAVALYKKQHGISGVIVREKAALTAAGKKAVMGRKAKKKNYAQIVGSYATAIPASAVKAATKKKNPKKRTKRNCECSSVKKNPVYRQGALQQRSDRFYQPNPNGSYKKEDIAEINATMDLLAKTFKGVPGFKLPKANPAKRKSARKNPRGYVVTMRDTKGRIIQSKSFGTSKNAAIAAARSCVGKKVNGTVCHKAVLTGPGK